MPKPTRKPKAERGGLFDNVEFKPFLRFQAWSCFSSAAPCSISYLPQAPFAFPFCPYFYFSSGFTPFSKV
jgi:hypothetical protein